MPTRPSACIRDHFADLTDPRRRKVTYPLVNIVTIAICAVICGADDFVAIAKFGRVKRKWLSRLLDLVAHVLCRQGGAMRREAFFLSDGPITSQDQHILSQE